MATVATLARSVPKEIDVQSWQTIMTALIDAYELLDRCGYRGCFATWRRCGGRNRNVTVNEACRGLKALLGTRSQKYRSRVVAELDKLEALRTQAVAEDVSHVQCSEIEYEPELVSLPGGLAELLGRTELPKIRKVPGKQLLTLADIGSALTNKDARHAAEDLRITISRYVDLDEKLVLVHFSCPGRQPVNVRVGNLAAVVEYIMLLPGKTAARIRAEAAKLLVRYLGGDLTLIDEVQEMRHVQEHLAEVDPTCWQRAFGEAAEASIRTDLPPESVVVGPPVDGFVSPKPMDLYIWYSRSLNVSRPGRTDNFERRLLEHRRETAADLFYILQAKGYGHLETKIHQLFRDRRTEPTNEKIPGRIDAQHLADQIPRLHKEYMEALEDSAPRGRKRTREDAEYDLSVAEIDAKIAKVNAEAELCKIKLELLRTGKITLAEFNA
jgi:hypothetical protein